MGLLCSKNFSGEEANAVTDPNAVGRGIEPMNVQADSTAEQVRRSIGAHLENLKNQQPEEHISNRVSCSGRKGSSLDDFYDGIPLVPTTLPHKSRSRRSTQAAVAKVCSSLFAISPSPTPDNFTVENASSFMLSMG